LSLLLHPPNPLHPLKPSVLDASPATLNAFQPALPSLRCLAPTLAARRSDTAGVYPWI